MKKSKTKISNNKTWYYEHGEKIFGTHSKISGDSSNILEDVSKIFGNVSLISGDVSKIHGCVSGISGDVSLISGDVSLIFGCVSGISGCVSNISGDVSNISGDVSNISGDVSNLKEGVKDLLYVVGTYVRRPNPRQNWELQGVFTSIKEADSACTKRTQFYFQLTTNKLYPKNFKHENVIYPRCNEKERN